MTWQTTVVIVAALGADVALVALDKPLAAAVIAGISTLVAGLMPGLRGKVQP